MTQVTRQRTSSAPTRHVYDVAVIGSHIGGALAATLLQRRGHHVLYIEHDGTGHGYAHQGYLLPYAPFVMPPLKAMPALDEALTEIGLTTTFQRSAHLPTPMLQLALDDARFDLVPDTKARSKELDRAIGDEAKDFARVWDDAAGRMEKTEGFLRERPDLPPQGFFARYKFNRTAGRFPSVSETLDGAKEPAAKLLMGLADFAVNVDVRKALASTRPLSLLLQGTHVWPGGRDGLRELLLNRLSELGGDVLAHDASTVVEEIAFDGNRIAGIKLVKSDTVYKTGCVIGATDAAALRRLISDKRKHRALAELLDGPVAKRILFSVNWVIPESVLPRGMGETVMLAPKDPTLTPILVQVAAARRVPGEPAADDDERVVTAGTFIEGSMRELGEDQLTALAERLNVELEALMTFTRAKARLVSAPYLHASGVRGSRLMPHPLLREDEDSLLGVTQLPVREPAKHLFLASREVLPGLGLEGEIMSGVRAARLVQETIKKANPLAKQ